MFNELDTQDEADMMDLATFFQTLSGNETCIHPSHLWTKVRYWTSPHILFCRTYCTGSGVLKDVDMDTSEQGINLDAIRIDNVGRLDSQLHDLDDFEIPAKVSGCGL